MILRESGLPSKQNLNQEKEFDQIRLTLKMANRIGFATIDFSRLGCRQPLQIPVSCMKRM